MRQVLCPVLVGREQEIQVLLDGLDRVAGGHGGVVFLAGEAGVGKSRLLRELSRRAGEHGRTVLTGRAVAGGVPVAFRPLAEAVLGGLRGSGEPDLPEVRPFQAALGRLVPQWRTPEPVAESPLVLGEGLVRLLHGLGARGAGGARGARGAGGAGGPRDARGCVLCLEDLHWADQESLTVLEYLADNVAGEGILVVGTLRADEDSPGRALVRTLVDRRAARLVEVTRLDGDATLRLARACLGATTLPAPVEAFLTDSADGLPFLIEELLAGLVGAGALVEQDGHWSMTGPLGGRVPPTFADAVARRMDTVDGRTRAVLHAAAVLGRRFDWKLLPAVTDEDQRLVSAALRQAVSAQLLTARPDGFQFRHALTRDAVLAGLAAPERARIAARALTVVEQLDPALAADLAELAGDRGRAAELLLTVGRRATEAGALATAETTLRRARELASDELRIAVPVDDALIDVLALSGQVDRAVDLGGRLLGRLDLAERLPAGGAELHLRLARAALTAGRWRTAAGHIDAGRPRPGLADVLDAQVALGEGRLEQAARLAATALDEAEHAGLPAVACEALEVAGRVARQRDLDAAEKAFTTGLAVATAHGLELWRLRALHELGTVDQLRTESVDRLRQARDLAIDVGALALVATLDLQIAAGLLKQFRPREGEAAARDSVVASRRLRLATLPMALVLEATAYAQTGRSEQMADCLAEALTLAPDDLDVQGSAWGHCRATASLLAGDRTRALAEMATGAHYLQQSPATVAPPFLGLRVLLLAVAGDDDTACREAARLRASSAIRHRIVASLLGYAEAVLHGRTAPAGALFHRADAEMGPLVAWYQQYARMLTAEAALTDGWGTPVPWLREAAAYFAARANQQIAAACRALLRRAGAPVPRPGPADPVVPAQLRALGVTRRESDVLALVAEGLTNQELAARLHLSPRTVEKHVAGLLSKTGCRRRTQLAGYFARLSG